MQNIRHNCYDIEWDLDCKENPNTLNIKCPSKESGSMILDIAYDLGLCVLKEEWHSKYNNYVVYDYEPFCTDGFNVVYKFDPTHRHSEFFLWKLFEDILPKMERLEKTRTTRYIDGLRRIKC